MAKGKCPVWMGYFLLCPLRVFAHDPEKILSPHVREGLTVLDVGCAMGFFSLPLARMVGPSGRVLCADVQEAMLKRLSERARKAGLSERIEARLCTEESLGLGDLESAADFALAFAVLHEVPRPRNFLADVFRALKPGALLLVAEPIFHVRSQAFEAELEATRATGFVLVDRPHIARARGALLRKPPVSPGSIQ